MKLADELSDWNLSASLAGLTAFVYFAFGALPLHLAISQQLGLTAVQTSSWVFIVWFNGALWTIGVCLIYRQPIPITCVANVRKYRTKRPFFLVHSGPLPGEVVSHYAC